MSKLNYSPWRSFSAYILLMHYQRTDPQVDSDQWLISQRLQKANVVCDNKRSDGSVWLLLLSRREEAKKNKSVQLLVREDRGRAFNKTTILFLMSHVGKKLFGQKNGKSVSRSTGCWKGQGWHLGPITSCGAWPAAYTSGPSLPDL